MISTPPQDPVEPAISDASWDAPRVGETHADQALLVDIDGFAGPLDLLLALARMHRIDLARLSILALVEQYLVFIAQVQKLNLEVAGDYLVMAAWLAFLKSRLLLPKEKPDGPELSGEEMAARLAFRLQRLDAMRQAAAQLMTAKRLGLDVFARGQPETTRTVRETTYTAEIFDLLKAYADQRQRTIKQVHVIKRRTVWSIKDARRRLEVLVGQSTGDWVQLELFLEQYLPAAPDGSDSGKAARGEVSRTVLAASFGATLEMAREGLVDLKQDAAFAPIYMRRKAPVGSDMAG